MHILIVILFIVFILLNFLLISSSTTFLLCLSIVFPLIVSLIINYSVSKTRKNFALKVKEINSIICKVSALIITFFFIFNILFNILNIDTISNIRNINNFCFYYVILLISFTYINFFSTNIELYQRNIFSFLNSINNIFKNNQILHLSFFIFIIIIKNYKELILALIGSYVFYILTEMNNEFNKQKIKAKNETLYILPKILLNYTLINYLTIFEMLYNYLVNGITYTFNYYDIILKVVLLIFMIIISNCYEFLHKQIIKIKEIFFKRHSISDDK